MADFIGLMYAGFVVFGGVVGYVKAGSSMSLLSGIVFGSCVTFGAYTDNHLIILLSSGLLGALMSYRFYITMRMLPGGVVTLTSFAIALRSALRLVT
uniref:Transmembrane protein 14C n=1 Tax=Syphacia muris TaxID=451379 RepID=A0A0N5AV09_9BILA